MVHPQTEVFRYRENISEATSGCLMYFLRGCRHGGPTNFIGVFDIRILLKKWRFAALVATGALALAACETAEPIEITQVERDRSFSDQGLIEMEPTSVRVVRKGNARIDGVGCELLGRGYSARFMAPAIVVIPEYGQASPLPIVTCTIADETASVQAKLQNRSEVETTGAMMNAGGLLGLVIGGAISGARQDKADDNYAFWPIIVEFPAQ